MQSNFRLNAANVPHFEEVFRKLGLDPRLVTNPTREAAHQASRQLKDTQARLKYLNTIAKALEKASEGQKDMEELTSKLFQAVAKDAHKTDKARAKSFEQSAEYEVESQVLATKTRNAIEKTRLKGQAELKLEGQKRMLNLSHLREKTLTDAAQLYADHSEAMAALRERLNATRQSKAESAYLRAADYIPTASRGGATGGGGIFAAIGRVLGGK